MKLLIETRQRAEVLDVFASTPATIVLDEVVPLFQTYGYFNLLIQIYRSANDERALLGIWSRCVSPLLLYETVGCADLIILRVAQDCGRPVDRQ